MSFKRQELQSPENTPIQPPQEAGTGGGEIKHHNIKSIKLPPSVELRTIDPPVLNRTGGLNYHEIRKRFITGDQASTRFVLNELSRKLMSVEEEENQRIEAEVQRRMKIIFENLYKKVEKEGHADGFAAGREDGKHDLLKEMAPAIEKFDELLKTFEDASHDIFVANEGLLFRLLSQVMKKILIKEVSVDQDYVRRVATGILERIGTKDNIKIFVSPASLVEAEKIKEGLSQSLGQMRNLTVEADASIRGGCRVETDFGAIDATIETQLARLDETLNHGEGS